ncbi:hypothetical protein J7E93_14590 [Streptomyces sp. ISL-36]|uniref:hypothetical protein n=1 Tax=Streptomyces sp. ISL-36 TaxID=2819182 RepID=UPI001BEC0686|nr:hypothetical protein [Streptomyces sp. ISL-36]MBT2441317.1 hypothetical protein [Streptomyces sp. ISL-36]
MRADIEAVTWNRLFHAYGTATDTAELLNGPLEGAGEHLGPYLEVAFPAGRPGRSTGEQRALAREMAACEGLWAPMNGNRRITLGRLGLPDDREAWRELGGTAG